MPDTGGGAESTQRSFGAVLANRPFRALWLAQLLAQTSQHAIHFIQMVVIERLTGSAVHLGLVIFAFSLPGVLFSPLAGVVVDRLPKKWVLVGSNLLRVLLAASYLLVLAAMSGTWQILAVYAVTFATATLAQFFSPAEVATIPLLVGQKGLLAANSLFSLTMGLSQVIGLLLLGPLSVSLLHVEGGFIVIGAMYLAAALLLVRLPFDRVTARQPDGGLTRWRRMLADAGEGWRFISSQARLKTAIIHLVTVTTLVMTMAMLAPGYAARVLGLAPESAIMVFAPAGLGMLLSSAILARWGARLKRLANERYALVVVGVVFGALGWLSFDYQRLMMPILRVYPQAKMSLAGATMGLAFALGLALSGVNILAQTRLQEETPAAIRGRVFSIQFMLNNLVGIPPMLVLGGMADAIGIPYALAIVGGGALLVAVTTTILERRVGRKSADASPLTAIAGDEKESVQ